MDFVNWLMPHLVDAVISAIIALLMLPRIGAAVFRVAIKTIAAYALWRALNAGVPALLDYQQDHPGILYSPEVVLFDLCFVAISFCRIVAVLMSMSIVIDLCRLLATTVRHLWRVYQGDAAPGG